MKLYHGGNVPVKMPEIRSSGFYCHLVVCTMQKSEDYADAMIRAYNHPICEIIDDYNSSAYYEPSYFLTRCYWTGSFN